MNVLVKLSDGVAANWDVGWTAADVVAAVVAIEEAEVDSEVIASTDVSAVVEIEATALVDDPAFKVVLFETGEAEPSSTKISSCAPETKPLRAL
jgi:hypothetical protein